MWNTITQYTEAAYQFLLQGRPAQEVIPLFMIAILAAIFYMFIRMMRGDAK